MKRLIALALTLILAFALVACSDSSNNNSGGGNSTNPPVTNTPDESTPTQSQGDNGNDPARTPDTPVDPNERGNTASNIINGGIIAEKDGWIYFTNPGGNRALEKARADGTEKTVLIDRDCGGGINVVGDWVYYAGAYGGITKVRTDGTDRTEIIRSWGKMSPAEYMTVIGEWIYYQRPEGNGQPEGFYKTRTNAGDGEPEQILLIEGDARYVNVVEDWIYYTIYDHAANGYAFCKMKMDGTEKSVIETEYVFEADNPNNTWGMEMTLLSSSLRNPIIDGDRVFCTGNISGIFMMGLDGEDTEQVVYNSQILKFAVADGWLYFAQSSPDSVSQTILCKSNFDGTEILELATGGESDFHNLHIIGEWLYFTANNPNAGGRALFKIRTDGTDKQVVSAN